MSQKLLEQIEIWLTKCPLTKFRKTGSLGKVTQGEVGILLGKSQQSVRNYEQGSYSPPAETMMLLAQIMKKKPEKLTREWKRWMNARPRP